MVVGACGDRSDYAVRREGPYYLLAVLEKGAMVALQVGLSLAEARDLAEVYEADRGIELKVRRLG
jgi:hypothetical protein